MKKPLISVIIVNYNGSRWLKGCLESIFNQTYKKVEVVFVDNFSTDESLQTIKPYLTKLTLLKNTENTGFAGGNNLGMKHAKGDFIVLLNNDTQIEKDYLVNFLQAFNKYPDAAIAQSKIVLMNKTDKLDTCGSFWTDSSFLYYYGNDKDSTSKKYNTPFPVFSVKAASVMIKRSVIDEIGLFDEDFWCYYEETDFCSRAWLAGYRCIYWPFAVCRHAMGGTSREHFKRDFVQFHNFKNKLMSFLKNFESKTLIFVIPKFLIINLLLSFYWLIQGKVTHSWSLYKAIYWNIININKNLKKRKSISKLRKVPDSQIFDLVQKNPGWQYYKALLSDNYTNFNDMPINYE